MVNPGQDWGIYGQPLYQETLVPRPFGSLGILQRPRLMSGPGTTWPAGSDPTDADSVPVLDGWGWADYWSLFDWIQWYGLVKAKYGKAVADKKFVDNYLSAGVGAASYDWRSFSEPFRAFLKSEELLDAAYGNVSALKIIGAAVDIVGKASDAASKVAELSNVLLYGGILVALFVGYQYIKRR